MKRRDFVSSVLVGGFTVPLIGDQQHGNARDTEDEHGGGHGHGDDDGRVNNATVSFGHWLPTPDYPADPAELNTANPQPIDRFAPNDPFPRRLNGHKLIPSPARIRVGGTVNFIVAGFHLLLVYGPGTHPADIDKTNLVPGSAPPLINDPNRRLYRGLDPRTQAQDRVEVVGFNTPGRYLVICGVLPHFFDMATGTFVMFGFVEVREDD